MDLSVNEYMEGLVSQPAWVGQSFFLLLGATRRLPLLGKKKLGSGLEPMNLSGERALRSRVRVTNSRRFTGESFSCWSGESALASLVE